MTVLIAGAGIAGLSLALTCHQIGVPVRVFEQVSELKPLGVGINLQPNAIRELFDLGFERELESIGVQTRDYGFYSKHGLEIWTEPRGKWAGYAWPQYSIHRGMLQMMLYRAVVERLGADAVETGWRADSFETSPDGAVLHLRGRNGEERRETGRLLVAADGVHSAIRAQMVPNEGPAIWNGAVLWRGTSLAQPFLSGASMVLIGHKTQRVVTYPLSEPDPETGLALINWIAEKTFDPSVGWQQEDWNRKADIGDFLPDFEDWRFDWLDVPALIRGAGDVFEYPMVDRDPLDKWTDGSVTLMGDAAHVTYPVGSNGASQAIVDARKLGRSMLDHGVTPAALEAYEDEMRPASRKIILANRGGGGPDAILQQVEDLCGGRFDRIEDVISHDELAAHAAKYKTVAGFGIEALNAMPAILPAGARLQMER